MVKNRVYMEPVPAKMKVKTSTRRTNALDFVNKLSAAFLTLNQQKKQFYVEHLTSIIILLF